MKLKGIFANKYLTILSVILIISAFILVSMGVTGVFTRKPLKEAASELMKVEPNVTVEVTKEKSSSKK